MDFHTFNRLATKFKTIPVYKKILADLLTPISAYLRLGKNSDYAFILESVEKVKGMAVILLLAGTPILF